MTRWNDGAVIDITARPRFHRETTPAWLVTACTLLGSRAPSLSKPFRYADLGCGSGFSALVVAATCPCAEVWGFDFNPANIEAARDLAEQAGLTNIRFLEVSFADLTAAELPRFDFMIADSVLNAVSPENQEHIYTLIGRHLRPGGLAYLGYACDAGWTGFTPLQTLMRLQFESGTDASDFAVRAAFSYVDQARTAGAAFFQRNPILERRLAELRTRPDNDLALELLNREWEALAFSDVADEMAEAKCEFLGRATLHENIVVASVPTAVLPLLEEAPSIRIRETMQDIAAGTVFRRDIYRRGPGFAPIAEHHARVEAVTVMRLSDDDLMLPTWQGPVPADLAIYQPLAEALRHGPLTIARARALGVLAGEPIEAAADAVTMLIAAGHAHPAMPAPMAREAAPSVARLNDAIIDAVSRGEEIGYLVSPLIGAAIEANPLEVLTVGALLRGGKPEDIDGLTDRVQVAMLLGGRTVTRAGAPVDDPAETYAILRDIVVQIVDRRLPLLRTLGVTRA